MLTSGRVRLIFHYTFPTVIRRTGFSDINCEEYDNSAAERRCMQFKDIVSNLYHMKRDILNHLADRMAEVDEMLYELPNQSQRRSRSLFTWLGSGIASVFGLSTYQDMHNVQTLLTKVLDGTQQAVQSWKNGQNLFTKVTRLSNERFQNIEAMLNMSQMSILDENRRLTNLQNEVLGSYKVMATVVQEIHLALHHIQETEALYHGIQNLINGKLSHHVVRKRLLQRALNVMAIEMRSWGRDSNVQYELIHNDIRYYYHQAEIGAAVHARQGQRTLFIVIHAPITLSTLSNPLTVWKLIPFPLKAPDNQIYFTMLKTEFTYIMYDANNPFYLVATNHDDLPQAGTTNFINIHDPTITLYRTNIPSCALSLFGLQLNNIKSMCGYHIIFKELPSEVFRISENKLLLNNIPSITVSRGAREYVKMINKTVEFQTPQSFYNIPCEAKVEVMNQIFFSTEHCDGWLEEELDNITFPINLPVLRHYFEDNELLSDVNAAIELNDTVSAKLPLLAVERPEYSKMLAIEGEYKFDFNKAINSSQSDELMYDSLAHLMWSKMVQTAANTGIFNPFDAFHWISLISLILSALNFIALCILYVRYKSISILLLSLPKVHGVQQFIFTTSTTAVPTALSFYDVWMSFQAVVSEIFALELILTLIFILLLVTVIVHFTRDHFRSSKNHTFVRLSVQANNLIYECGILRLSYPPHFYRLDIHPITLTIDSTGYFSRLNFGNSIQITGPGQQLISYTNSALILPWKLSLLKNILKNPEHRAMLILLNNRGTIIDILPLPDKSETGRTLSTMAQIPMTNQLYPAL